MPEVTEDKKLEILNDHYKESCTHLKDFLRYRDILFFGIIIAVTIMLYWIFSPQKAGDAINQFITGQLDLENQIDASFIDSITWFILFALILRYFQNIVSIERQYDYIHMLEERLSKYYDDEVFTREGKFYKKDSPRFSKWAWVVYNMIFPALLFIVVTMKIFDEISWPNRAMGLIIFNTAAWLAIVISIVFYIIAIHCKKSDNRY